MYHLAQYKLESGPIPDRVVMFSAINHGWAFKRCL